jgi:hypothetical protein
MPPSEPIRQQLIAKIVTRLQGIAAGGTYWYTPCEVAQDWRSFTEIPKLAQDRPFYGVIEGDENNEYNTFGPTISTKLIVIIVGWITDQKDRRRALNRAIGDVQKAIFSDAEWTGSAFNTRPVRVSNDEAALVAKPFGYFELEMEIEYIHAEGTV